MLARFIPVALTARGARLVDGLKAAPRQIAEGRTKLSRRARERARAATGEGQDRLWTLQAEALEQIDGLLERTTEIPVLSRVTEPAGRFVHGALATATQPRVPNYDALNVKEVVRALPELDRLELLRVRRHEQGEKRRKTVLEAVARELKQRSAIGEAA